MASQEDETLLRDVLLSVGQAPSDLGLRPESITQPYVLSVVKEQLTRPFAGMRPLQERAERILAGQKDPQALYSSLGRLADVDLAPAAARPADKSAPSEADGEVPAWAAEAIDDFFAALAPARAAVAAARGSFTEQERAELDAFFDETFGDAPPPAEEPPITEPSVRERLRAVELAGKVPRAAFLAAARDAHAAADRLRRRLAAERAKFYSVSTVRFRRPEGWVTLGGLSNDAHELGAEDVLAVDLGGDDVYRGAPAAGLDGRVAVTLDLEGDDLYASTASVSLGSGRWGVGLLADMGGNDVYRGRECVQGCGVFGAGVLVDGGGDDVYEAVRVAQGAAFAGWGLLSDLEGQDGYRADTLAQGASGLLGLGVLADAGGNDQYLAGFLRSDPREAGVFQSLSQGFSIGIRDYAAGGAGALLDGGGHDLYKVDYFGQGASYWFSLGLLYDRRGRDTYVGRRYSQGIGVHSSVAALLDAGGDDTYYTWGGGQGHGWDMSLGVLLDQSGSDVYHADWNAQGGSGAGGWGVLADNAGADVYYGRDDFAQGVGSWDERRTASSLGLFMDSGADDRYSGAGRAGVWNTDRWGAGVDASSGPPATALVGSAAGERPFVLSEDLPPAGEDPGEAQEKEERAALENRLAKVLALADPALKVPELLQIAGHWGLDEKTPPRARRALLALSTAAAFPALTDAMDCRLTMAYFLQEELYLRYGRTSVEALSAVLAADAPSPDDVPSMRRRSYAHFYLGQLGSTRPVAALLALSASPAWRDRASAAGALGRIYEKRLSTLAGDLAASASKGKNELKQAVAKVPYKDRLRLVFELQPVPQKEFEPLMEKAADQTDAAMDAAWTNFLLKAKKRVMPALERRRDLTPPAEAAAALERGLADPDKTVRQAAAAALGRMGLPASAAALSAALGDEQAAVRSAAVWALGQIGLSGEGEAAEVLASTRPAARAAALEALAAMGSPRTFAAAEAALASDADWSVRWRALDTLWRQRASFPDRKSQDLEPLFRAAQEKDAHPWLRGRAAHYLTQLAHETASR